MEYGIHISYIELPVHMKVSGKKSSFGCFKVETMGLRFATGYLGDVDEHVCNAINGKQPIKPKEEK